RARDAGGLCLSRGEADDRLPPHGVLGTGARAHRTDPRTAASIPDFIFRLDGLSRTAPRWCPPDAVAIVDALVARPWGPDGHPGRVSRWRWCRLENPFTRCLIREEAMMRRTMLGIALALALTPATAMGQVSAPGATCFGGEICNNLCVSVAPGVRGWIIDVSKTDSLYCVHGFIEQQPTDTFVLMGTASVFGPDCLIGF